MSREENDGETKIPAVDNSGTRDETFHSKSKASTSQSKNCNMLDKAKVELTAAALDNVKLSPSSSDDNSSNEDLSRARDSLECLPNKEKVVDCISSSKSQSCTTSKDKYLISESPHSESLLGNSKSSSGSSSVSKVFSWDPWDKLSRKSKKENKRRKTDKSNEPTCSASMGKEKDMNRRDFKSGDESTPQVSDHALEDNYEEYSYQPFQKQSRSVEFTNEVMVVYINKEDKVVGETSEPLKKELEQQKRNKEMRRGHMPDAPFARRNSMSEWFKK